MSDEFGAPNDADETGRQTDSVPPTLDLLVNELSSSTPLLSSLIGSCRQSCTQGMLASFQSSCKGSDSNEDCPSVGRKRKRTKAVHWLDDELDRLKHGVQQFGHDFVKVSEYVRTRTRQQCQTKLYSEVRAGRIIDSTFSLKGSWAWKPEETRLLKNLVNQYGRDFAQISKKMRLKTRYQIKKKVDNETRAGRLSAPEPKRNATPWLEDELRRLSAAIINFGCDWGKISEYVGTRTRQQCWKKVNKYLKPRTLSKSMDANYFLANPVNWSDQELFNLEKAVRYFGLNDVQKISDYVGTKSLRHCRLQLDFEAQNLLFRTEQLDDYDYDLDFASGFSILPCSNSVNRRFNYKSSGFLSGRVDPDSYNRSAAYIGPLSSQVPVYETLANKNNVGDLHHNFLTHNQNSGTQWKRWTEDELQRLAAGFAMFGRNQSRISSFVITKSERQCRYKLEDLILKGKFPEHSDDKYRKLSKKRWTVTELNMLHNAVTKYGRNFVEISKTIGTKSREQCKRKLDLEIRAGRFVEPSVAGWYRCRVVGGFKTSS